MAASLPEAGTPVRLEGLQRRELEGAEGVVGRLRTQCLGKGERALVHVRSPAAAAAAYPDGVYVKPDKLRVLGPPDASLLPDDAALDADRQLRASLQNLDVPQRKDACLHGAPKSTDAIVRTCSAFIQPVADAPSAEVELARADAWLRAHPRPEVPLDTLRRVLLCMATDAMLAEDVAVARQLARAALAVQSFQVSGCVQLTDELRDLQRSDWHVRRLLALSCDCQCFGVRHAATCALPGCDARHEVGGVRLLACASCRLTWYCSKTHQQEHWRAHKRDCKRATGGAAAG
jgi:hypothetical protein